MTVLELILVLKHINQTDGDLDIKMIQDGKIFSPVFEVRIMGDNRKHLIVGDRRKENR